MKRLHGISVWAPYAKRVHLLSQGRNLPMARGETGIFTSESQLETGADYAFSLDGSPPLPDPRSHCQPQGVHGASRVLDQDDFDWSDSHFRAVPLPSAVIYELHVGTFSQSGTFEGAIEHLDHLVCLGVTHLELMPIASFSGDRGWGYDGVNLYAAHEAYGGSLGLKRLVDACHARGLAVLLDVVYNHLGPVGNYLPRFGPYFNERYHTPWGAATNLDGGGAHEARRFFIENALYWLQHYHFDGLRLDAVHALYDRSAQHFLQQLAREVQGLSVLLAKPIVLIAESDLNDPRLIRSAAGGGFGLDAQWNDDFHHALHVVLTGEQQGYYSDFRGLEELARALTRGFVYDGQYSPHRQRQHGAPLGPTPLRRLVGFLQNHDQIGNRARGERIGQLTTPRRVRLGAALVLLGPFVPLLFQGEEWNASTPFQYFCGHEDPELTRAVREGRQREFAAFGWSKEEIPDPTARETFEASKLKFEEISKPEHAAMLTFYRALIRLRRERSELSSAPTAIWHDEGRRVLLLEREHSAVAVNFGNDTTFLPRRRLGEQLVHAEGDVRLDNGTLVLPAESLAVLVSPQFRLGPVPE